MASTSKQILNYIVDLSKNYEGLTALYVINLNKMKMKSHILEDIHNKNCFLERMKKIALTLRDDDFEMLLVELDERIICKKVDDSHIIIFVTDKEMTLGRIFTLIRGIDYKGDTSTNEG